MTKKRAWIVITSAALVCALLVAGGAANLKASAAPHAQPPADALVSGQYAGTVLIEEPLALGELDLALDATSQDLVLSGQIDSEQTLAFGGSPSLQGNVTVDGVITPTFTLSSNFAGEISGRTVSRVLFMEGEVLDGGAVLQGSYAETVSGFTPEPLIVRGDFVLLRPADSPGSD